MGVEINVLVEVCVGEWWWLNMMWHCIYGVEMVDGWVVWRLIGGEWSKGGK